MKRLVIRNLALRKTTLSIYLVLALLSPLLFLTPSSEILSQLGKTITPFLVALYYVLSIKDSAHIYRVHDKLGNHASLYFKSLPVSKKQLLNANYLTMLIFTLFGAIVLTIYTIPYIKFGLGYTIPFSYIAINFFTIAIVFRTCSEEKSENINYFGFLLIMCLLIPLSISVIYIGVRRVLFGEMYVTFTFNPWFNFTYLVVGTVMMLGNYLIQLKKIDKGGI
ncbi:ABC-2 transporter permease [Staphylococcus sp. SQ8-PEA]|uniref:ABC-2 transporter permease n=1 Tax=Staphylococcus marylandisciuri TaxID=2981529 RepID=A0ABT2QQC4_9STAP|nr:ABC-2 transporter permease [Staphylococcus marylandisciuri]MCU5746178.1 ABC-2 transporter permease [Staphylococcus marylandisciuri]